MRASVQQARADTCSTCLLFIQQRAQGTCQLATIAHCAMSMSCQGQQEQCASHPALSNKARSGIRCRTCVLLCAGRSACVSWAQVMVSAHSPAGDGQGSFTLTMVPVLTSLGNVCTSASLLSSCHKNYFGKNASPTVINSKPAVVSFFLRLVLDSAYGRRASHAALHRRLGRKPLRELREKVYCPG